MCRVVFMHYFPIVLSSSESTRGHSPSSIAVWGLALLDEQFCFFQIMSCSPTTSNNLVSSSFKWRECSKLMYSFQKVLLIFAHILCYYLHRICPYLLKYPTKIPQCWKHGREAAHTLCILRHSCLEVKNTRGGHGSLYEYPLHLIYHYQLITEEEKGKRKLSVEIWGKHK